MTADVRRDMSRQWIEVTFNYQWFDPRGREHKEKLVFVRQDGKWKASLRMP